MLLVGYPLWVAFDLGDLGADMLMRTALPVGIGACLVWIGAIVAWFLPLWQAVQARRRGERVNKELAARAYRVTLKGPVRALILRTARGTGAAGLTGLFLHIYRDWPLERIAEMGASETTSTTPCFRKAIISALSRASNGRPRLMPTSARCSAR